MAFGEVPTIGQSGVLEAFGEAERGLAAELDDDADDAGAARGLAALVLGLEDLGDVFEGERFEVEPVGGVVVGGDGLGVAVDHDGLVADLAQGLDGVDARVVELDALADAVGPGAEDHHLRTVRGRDLGLVLVGRVVVGRVGLEFGGAGVDGLEDRAQAEPVAQAAHAFLAGEFGAQGRDLGVGASGALRLAQQRFVDDGGGFDLAAQVDELGDLVEEPRVDLAGLVDFGDGGAESQGAFGGVEGAVVRGLERLERVLEGGALGVGAGPESGRPWSRWSAGPSGGTAGRSGRGSWPRRRTSWWWSGSGRRRGTSRR